MSRCFLSLGGNVGNVAATFQQAITRLASDSDNNVVAVSRNYRTAAVGLRAGSDFLNAAVCLETQKNPLAVLDALQDVETDLGRTREIRWGPRTLDLDLILYDDLVLSTSRLTVPHPHFWYRRFVLDPLTEIAANAVHPVSRQTVAQLRENILRRPVPCWLAGTDHELLETLRGTFQKEFPEIELTLHSGPLDEVPDSVVPVLVCVEAQPPMEPPRLWIDLRSLSSNDEFRSEAVSDHSRVEETVSACRNVFDSIVGRQIVRL